MKGCTFYGPCDAAAALERPSGPGQCLLSPPPPLPPRPPSPCGDGGLRPPKIFLYRRNDTYLKMIDSQRMVLFYLRKRLRKKP